MNRDPLSFTPTAASPSQAGCRSPRCGCGAPGLARRDFLKLSGLAASAALAAPWEAMAGPFTRADFEKLVPADKKLRPEWVKSLFDRGSRTEYRGAELEKIGMPIGGICCGQVYLGGDGKLWHWDIFNHHIGTGAEHYAKPLTPASPLDQGFALRVTVGGTSQVRPLDRTSWRDVSFIGEYPIGFVEYRDADCPVNVSLEAFSPFIPLNVDDSSLPATVMQFTVRNGGADAAEIELAGWLENAICLHSGAMHAMRRKNRVVRRDGFLFVECSAEAVPEDASSRRPDIVFDDFEKPTYEGWTATGTAFGQGPVTQKQAPDYQGDLGIHGQRAVNSHASAPGADVGARDAAKGTLTSRPFKIERNFITFLIGGGNSRGKTCLNVLVDDKVVASATGVNENRMRPRSLDVRRWAGRTARLQIVDDASGSWGNIGVDDLVFSDRPHTPPEPLAQEPDFGTMGIALLKSEIRNQAGGDFTVSGLAAGKPAEAVFAALDSSTTLATKPLDEPLLGGLGRKLSLTPGASATVSFLLTWHLPNLKMNRLPPGRYYAQKFESALAVADYVGRDFSRLSKQTRLWHDTWYDSTLPYWFLDRTFLNASILATSTCFRLGDGRFWAWEGVGCCEGTCGHVWQYAHAMARLFPELERIVRERVDFGLALQPDGAIHFRGEFNDIPAIDAQAGTILRALREHQMSADDAFLKRNWPQIQRATGWLIAKDANGDGLIESNQHNTLDTDWFGPVAWLSGLYLSALRAAEAMANEVGDRAFAGRCRAIFDPGQKNFVAQLFDGDYFINKVAPKHLDAINSGTGCEIDQVFGQSWAFQVGMPRVLPEMETRSALKSLWRYNFTPDVGPYREAYKAGRWYAMPGEAGLLMCTFPRSDWDYAQAKGKGPEWAAGYFDECMNGFEYQVGGHMIWEGMLLEGLAVTRAVHDRYHAARRNPWNEVECGDHYARSKASYGVFLAACGYEHHGPKGRLGFAPRLTPENFRCAFTTAAGWGTFTQKAEGGMATANIQVKLGKLRLRTLALRSAGNANPTKVTVTVVGKPASATLAANGGNIEIRFAGEVVVSEGENLRVELT